MREQTRRTTVVLLSIIGLLLGGFVALAAPARAASIYDSVYQTTDSLIISNNPDSQSQYSCPELDIATEYMSLMQDPNNWVSEDSYNWFMPGFMQAVSSGGAWAITQQEVYYGNSKIVNVGYSLQSGKELEWHTDRVEVSDMMTVSIEHIKYDWITCQPIVGGVSGEGGAMELSGALSGSGIRNFLAYGFDPNYPSGYEGEEIRETWSPPPAKYVAMGDSFSSGEGNPPFESGTDTGTNQCHRSSQAYPRLLAADPSLDLGPMSFVACSGATTANITGSGQWGEPRQLDALNDNIEVVTLTIGGNDVGFGTVLTSCTLLNEDPPWPMSQDAYDQQICLDAMEDAERKVYGLSLLPSGETLQDALDNTLESVADEIGDNTEVYIIGYPYLFPEYTDIQGSCMWGASYGAGFTSARSASENEVNLLRDVTGLLNTNLLQAVNRLGDGRFEYVDPTAEFEGHGLCRWDSYITHIHYSVDSGHYHPNEDGQLAYHRVVKEAII